MKKLVFIGMKDLLKPKNLGFVLQSNTEWELFTDDKECKYILYENMYDMWTLKYASDAKLKSSHLISFSDMDNNDFIKSLLKKENYDNDIIKNLYNIINSYVRVSNIDDILKDM